MREKLKDFYSTSREYVDFIKSHQERHAKVYLPFVEHYVPRGARILKLAVGPGLAAHLLSQHGYEVVGIDISMLLVKETKSYAGSHVRVVVGDVLDLPFSDAAFDAVSSLYFLEHVVDVEKALSEMVRVLKQRGLLLIKSPNLVSPYTSFIKLVGILAGSHPKSSLWGETWQRAVWILIRNWYYCMRKSISSKPHFIYRQPELDVMESDADSVYLLSQMDLRNFFRKRHFPILNLTWGRNRCARLLSRAFAPLAPSVGFVVRKI